MLNTKVEVMSHFPNTLPANGSYLNNLTGQAIFSWVDIKTTGVKWEVLSYASVTDFQSSRGLVDDTD